MTVPTCSGDFPHTSAISATNMRSFIVLSRRESKIFPRTYRLDSVNGVAVRLNFGLLTFGNASAP